MSSASNSGAYSSLFLVTIGGAPLPPDLAEALGESWVDSSVNLPAAFHLTFRDPKRLLMQNNSGLLRIGATVKVDAVADGQGEFTSLIKGVVTGVEIEHQDGSQKIVVRGFDDAFKMLRQRRTVGYYKKTASEIVRELAGLDGVEIGEIETTVTQYDLITQPNISDWEFVQYLADANDMEADFSNEGKLRFRKAKPAAAGAIGSKDLDLELGVNILYCRAGVTASDQVSTVTSRGWKVDEKEVALGEAPAVEDPDSAIELSPVDVASAFARAKLTETRTPYGTAAEADHAASSLAADITSAFAELEIEAKGQPALMSRKVVTLKGVGKSFDGMYTVSTTRHVLDRKNGYTTWVWVTGRQVRTLYGLAAGGGESAPRIHGVVNAIVDDITDPLQQGRVILRFPWFDDNYKTDWVRTVQFGGKKGGGVISPEVDDEVLVAFDRGVMDYPYVLGGLYSNAENKPSPHDVKLQTGGRLNRRSLVSRSGQRLEILDADGETGVRLRSGDEKLTVFLEETQSKITISSKGTVDISGVKAVSVTSDAQLTLSGREVSISGTNVSIKGATTITGSVSQTEGPVNIAGDVNMMGDVNVLGDTNMLGALDVVGDLNVGGLAAVVGDITMDGQQVVVI